MWRPQPRKFPSIVFSSSVYNCLHIWMIPTLNSLITISRGKAFRIYLPFGSQLYSNLEKQEVILASNRIKHDVNISGHILLKVICVKLCVLDLSKMESGNYYPVIVMLWNCWIICSQKNNVYLSLIWIFCWVHYKTLYIFESLGYVLCNILLCTYLSIVCLDFASDNIYSSWILIFHLPVNKKKIGKY